jgi:hypothetical protein
MVLPQDDPALRLLTEANAVPLIADTLADDPTIAASAATMAQSTAGLVPVWKANTSYTAGQRVIAPSGDIVSAKVAFTSAATYLATNWNASTQDSRVGALEVGKWYKGDLPSATDLNTLLTPGLWSISNNTLGDTILNRPTPLGDYRSGYVQVLKTGTLTYVQTFYGPKVTVERQYRSSAWQQWHVTDGQSVELVAGDNLDNLKAPGWYSVTFASTGNQITGWPATMGTKTGLVHVQQLSAGGTGWQQTIYPLTATQQWVRTGAATWNAWVDALAAPPAADTWYKGDMPNATDLNTLLTPGLWSISNNTLGDTVLSRPTPLGDYRSGYVQVLKTGTLTYVQTFYGPKVTVQRHYRSSAWQPWHVSDGQSVELVPGDNLDNLKMPGWYSVTFGSTGNQITGWPATMGTKTALIEVQQVSAGGTGWQQTVYPLSATQQWIRTGAATWNAWVDALAAPPGTALNPYAGLANSLRVDDWSDRRGGRKKTGGVGAVAFRFDHGLLNYRDYIRGPLLAAGIVGSLALCSRQWAELENAGVTAADVNAWVAAGEVEIWNHSATHADASTYEALTDTIVAGLAELRAQLPAAVIDGFVIPGVGGGTNLGGLNGGTTPENFFGTDAGRLILEHHAVSTGAYPLTDRRILDGRVRQGMGHQTIDTLTATGVIDRIKLAQAEKSGLQIMLHPSTITTGTLTVAGFQEVLDYVVAERAAGRLKVYSPYDLLLADAT